MALVKMVRGLPEFPGAPTEAMVPEESVKACVENGWKVADVKPSKTEKEEKVEEAPKVESKPEVKKDEKKGKKSL